MTRFRVLSEFYIILLNLPTPVNTLRNSDYKLPLTELVKCLPNYIYACEVIVRFGFSNDITHVIFLKKIKGITTRFVSLDMIV